MIGLILFLAALIVWIRFSVRKLEHTEIAGLRRFYRLIKQLGPGGIYFIPRLPGCDLVKRSTEKFRISVEIESVSNESEYQGKFYDRVAGIKAGATLSLSNPKNERLLRVIENKVPDTQQELQKEFEKPLGGIVASALSKVTWIESYQDRNKVRMIADELVKLPESFLKIRGFEDEDFSLSIDWIDIPEGLKKAISQPLEEKYKAQAAEKVADQQAEKTIGLKVKMLAKAYGMKPEDVQRLIYSDENLKKAINKESANLVEDLIALDKNALVRIRLDGVQGIDKTILAIVALLKNFPSKAPPKEKKKSESEYYTAEEIEEL